jgi:putative ABC transport system permease protein
MFSGRHPNLTLHLALCFLRRTYGRLALTVLALALGVSLVCAIDLVNRAVLRAFVEVVDTMAGRAALQVTGGQGTFIAEDVAAVVAAVPGVELTVPVVSATTFVAGEGGEALTVHGVDITNEKAVRVYESRDAGGFELGDPLVFLNQPDSIVLTRQFARRHRLGVGDSIMLETSAGRRAFVVRGLLEPQGVARVYGGNLVVMDLYAAEAVFSQPGFVNRIDIVVDRARDVSRVRDAIASVLPAGLRVEAPDQRRADLHKVMQSLQVLLQGVGLIGLIAAFLIAFNRLSTVFEARSWQLGVLRAVGLRMGTVWWELLKESLLVGIAGVVLGIPLGILLARLVLPVVANTTALAYQLVVPETRLDVQGFSIFLAVAVGLGAAILAAALPAWRAARLEAITLISGRGIEQPDVKTGRHRRVLAILATSALACAILQSVTESATWGLLASGLIAVLTALSSRPLVQALPSPLLHSVFWMLGASHRFGTAIVARNPRRAGLTIGMIGVGLGSAVWLWTIARSFERSVIDLVVQAYRADLMVTSMHFASGWSEAPLQDQLLGALEAIDGVQAVAGHRIIDWQYADGPIAIEAYDPAYFRDRAFGEWPLVGPASPDVWAAVARGEAVVVSSNFLQNLGRRVGDTITLDTPSGPLEVRIGGATTLFASPRGTIELSRDLYKRFWRDTQVNRAFLRVAPGADPAVVTSMIADQLGRTYSLRVLAAGSLVEYWTGQVRRAFAAVYPLAGMVLLVVLVGTADTLAASVAERTRELGVIRAVGVRRRFLGRMVMVEALILGTLGLVLAIASGLALGILWVGATFPYLLGWVLQLHLPFLQVGVAVLITVAVCLVASALPARRATRLEPAAALRYE